MMKFRQFLEAESETKAKPNKVDKDKEVKEKSAKEDNKNPTGKTKVTVHNDYSDLS